MFLSIYIRDEEYIGSNIVISRFAQCAPKNRKKKTNSAVCARATSITENGNECSTMKLYSLRENVNKSKRFLKIFKRTLLFSKAMAINILNGVIDNISYRPKQQDKYRISDEKMYRPNPICNDNYFRSVSMHNNNIKIM